jgi:peptide/nickel transport system permease protein
MNSSHLAESASGAAKSDSAVTSTRRLGLKRIVRDRAGLVGAVLVILALGAATLGPFLAPYPPDEIHSADQLAPPSMRYLLGTDEIGRDMLSRLLHGARVSLTVALTAVTIAGTIGTSVGIIAGYFERGLDTFLMRLMDVFFIFPTILLALVLVTALGPNTRNLIIAIVIVYIPDFARIARASTKQVCVEPYVEVARSVGASDARIISMHVLPNITAPIIVQTTVNLAYAILVEAALSFLGLGVQPPTPSWGAMLSTGKAFLEFSPWIALFPGLAIMVTVLGFNMLGDSLRDLLDPRLYR